MNEQKVRDAAKVATEMAKDLNVPKIAFGQVWQTVFDRMLWPDPEESTASEEQRLERGE